MPPEEKQAVELLDLKLLPSWVKETPEANAYAHYEGETEQRERHRREQRMRVAPVVQQITEPARRDGAVEEVEVRSVAGQRGNAERCSPQHRRVGGRCR